MELRSAPDLQQAQLRYARILAIGTAVGLGLLVLGFIAYVSGWIEPHIPIERLPQFWTRPSGEMLAEARLSPGWGWAALLHRGDMLLLAAIALLASCSIPCLAAVVPVFRRRGEQVFVAICVMEIAVLALAASGILSVAH